MNCFDCAALNTKTPAVAICHDCGAGLCTQHASVSEHHLTITRALNMQVPVEPPQRRIRCSACTNAIAAQRHLGK